jgi:hypothetical protein
MATETVSRALSSAKKHAPKKQRGQVVIEEDKVNRERAKYNKPDESKLTVVLKMGHPDTDNEGKYINVEDVPYRYQRTVDWLDRKSIKSLNDWRDQVRGTGLNIPSYKAREL